NWEDALATYKKGLLVGPFHAGCHYKIGAMAAHEGELTRALLSYSLALLCDPASEATYVRLGEMENVLSGEFEAIPKGLELSPEGEESFKNIDTGIKNKFALSTDYKYPHKKMDFGFARHTHFMMEATKDLTTEGYWGTMYLPFFKEVSKRGSFNYLINMELLMVGDPKVQKYLNKGGVSKKTLAFLNWFSAKWPELQSEKVFPRSTGDELCDLIYSDYRRVLASGEFLNNKFNGETEIYSYYGCVSAKGKFDEQGKKVGEWHYFYDDGTPKEISNYSDGKGNGPFVTFNENGTKSYEGRLLDDAWDGPIEEYNSLGVLDSRIEFDKGTPLGKVEFFYTNGALRVLYAISDGKVNGKLEGFWPDGSKYRDANFEDGQLNGVEKFWHLNGQLGSEVTYKNDERNGPYTSYYKDGSIERQGNYLKDNLSGEVKEFYKNGKILSVGAYDDSGKMNGLFKEYDQEGNLVSELTYKNGEIVHFVNYDNQGNLLCDTKKKGNSLAYKSHYNDGVLEMEGIYDIGEANKNGTWKYYNKNGVLQSQEEFNEEGLNGEKVSYSNNGQKNYVANFVDGKLNGELRWYYDHGQLKREGQANEGLYCGEFRNYYANGTLRSKIYYLDDQQHGNQEYYDYQGNLDQVELFDKGILLKIKRFHNEELYEISELTEGQGSYSGHYPNGEIMSDLNFINYEFEGEGKYYSVNGELSSESVYMNGRKNGESKSYFLSGELASEGSYSYGSQEGEWKWYYKNGKVATIRNFIDGELQGVYERFYENGSKELEMNYIDDELHGEATYFDPSGKVQMIRQYHYGKMINITWLDKNGKRLPWTPIENESIKIKTYYQNGKVARDFEMDKGLFVGQYLEYTYSGNLLAETNYLNGTEHGETKEYHLNGKLKSNTMYAHGFKEGE
ncbi:MAG: toxin-antitoxin system YwqK family antitoxin, partial [Flavobacteriales bacterium]